MDLRTQAHRPWFHAFAAALFVAVNAAGYRWYGGIDFVQGWGGGIAAVIATWFLVFKSQGYWAWMIVNAGLWTYLFFHVGLPMLAYLQIAFLVFACYGAVQWAMVKYRIGFNPRVRIDVVGSVIALGLCTTAVLVYWNQPGYRGTTWWWLEFGSVFTAIAAMWMDAFRYRANWIMWSLGNVCSAPLFFHGKLWGPFWTIFIYQAINVYGWIVWSREQRLLRAPRPDDLEDLEDDRGIVASEQLPMVVTEVR